jgi:adenylate cyclase
MATGALPFHAVRSKSPRRRERISSGSGLERVDRVPPHPWVAGSVELVRSWGLLARGEPREALQGAEESLGQSQRLRHEKVTWRCRVAAADALLELGRIEDAARVLPAVATRTEVQDVVYDSPARIRILLARGEVDEALAAAREIAAEPRLHLYGETLGLAVEALCAAELLDEAREVVASGRARPALLGGAGLDEAEGRIRLATGDVGGAVELLEAGARALRERGLPLAAWRVQILLAEAVARAGDAERAAVLLEEAIKATERSGARRLRDLAVATATGLELAVPVIAEEPPEPEVERGERLVTSLFADVRGYTAIVQKRGPEELADQVAALHRLAAAEVGRRRGIVDKFAGDAVMATFNAVDARVDHATQALEAALALRDKAVLVDLPVGVGIASGPAVVGRTVPGANLSVLGTSTNLAARLQAAAGGGEILLSDEAYRRVEPWLRERGLEARREELELKGFDGRQPAYRLPSPVDRLPTM